MFMIKCLFHVVVMERISMVTATPELYLAAVFEMRVGL